MNKTGTGIYMIAMLAASSVLAGGQESTKLNRQQYLDSRLVTITLPLASFSATKEAFYDLSSADQADLLSQCKNRSHERYMQLNSKDPGAEIEKLLYGRCFKLTLALNWAPYNTARDLVGWDEPINWDKLESNDDHR